MESVKRSVVNNVRRYYKGVCKRSVVKGVRRYYNGEC